MTRHVIVSVLLLLGVASLVCAVIGLLVARDVYERLHYLSLGTLLGVGTIAAAIIVQEALSQAGMNAIFMALIIFITNPILTHATARAARIRQFGDGQPRSEEKAP